MLKSGGHDYFAAHFVWSTMVGSLAIIPRKHILEALTTSQGPR
jgi:hypothetical protein